MANNYNSESKKNTYGQNRTEDEMDKDRAGESSRNSMHTKSKTGNQENRSGAGNRESNRNLAGNCYRNSTTSRTSNSKNKNTESKEEE